MEQSHSACVRDFKNGAAALAASIRTGPVEISVGALHQGGIRGDRVAGGRVAIERIDLGELAGHGKFKKGAGIAQTTLLRGAVENAVASQNKSAGDRSVGGERA